MRRRRNVLPLLIVVYTLAWAAVVVVGTVSMVLTYADGGWMPFAGGLLFVCLGIRRLTEGPY